MTNTTVPDELLKSDALGRVWTTAERREALLDEFERSGLTGQKFAALVGVKYPTFASWIQKRRRARSGSTVEREGTGAELKTVHWLEAVAEAKAEDASELRLELPGGACVRVADSRQAVLAARLLRELAAVERPC